MLGSENVSAVKMIKDEIQYRSHCLLIQSIENVPQKYAKIFVFDCF